MVIKIFQIDDMLKLFQLSILLILFAFSSTELFAQQMADTSKVLVKFNEPMSRDGIFDTDNYVIYRDDDTPIAIYKVGIVAGDTAVVLYTEKYLPQSSYKLIINNLRDKAGNIINENHKLAFY
jgi:hypothetical protein